MASEKEKKIRDLAKTLLKSGFVMSESEALSKAGEIVETEEKVTVRKDQTDKKEGGLFSKIKHAFHRHKEEIPEPPEDMPSLAAESTEDVDFSGDERPLNEIMQDAGVEIEKSPSAEPSPSVDGNPFDNPVEEEDPQANKEALVAEADHQRALAEKAEALEKELEAVKAKLREMKKYPKKEEISEIKTEIREMSQEMDELEYEEKKSEED